MSEVHKSAVVPYSAAQLYHLVNDIEAYPQFLPWCASSKIVSRTPHEMWATISMQKGQLRKSFTTRNHLYPEHRIQLRLVDGPFRKLEGEWRFDACDEKSCRVNLDLEFDFSGPLLKLLIGPFFDQIAHSLVDAFCRRAAQVHNPAVRSR